MATGAPGGLGTAAAAAGGRQRCYAMCFSRGYTHCLSAGAPSRPHARLPPVPSPPRPQVHVGWSTLDERVREFRATAVSALTAGEFEEVARTADADEARLLAQLVRAREGHKQGGKSGLSLLHRLQQSL